MRHQIPWTVGGKDRFSGWLAGDTERWARQSRVACLHLRIPLATPRYFLPLYHFGNHGVLPVEKTISSFDGVLHLDDGSSLNLAWITWLPSRSLVNHNRDSIVSEIRGSSCLFPGWCQPGHIFGEYPYLL